MKNHGFGIERASPTGQKVLGKNDLRLLGKKSPSDLASLCAAGPVPRLILINALGSPR